MATEVIVQATLFDSLVRCAPMDGALRADLLAAGYDVDRPRALYPGSVFIACQTVVQRAAYSHLGPKAAQRQMGRDLVRSYFETLVGRVVGMALKVAGPERAMKRVALSFKSVFEPVYIQTLMLAPSDWRVEFRNYPFPHESAAGTCEGALRQAGAENPSVEVERSTSAEDFDLRIRW
ncbi:DUF2378 family protein [Myxococcus sp. K15C18031901]|uniref:DUF2378 family protein n=1 Tax=Myxococcus dinghuensis TaxID=2906761 RepID=UPI0020A75F0F|nr:DUF2378 family protein [Myxococcus dinghuensis]MCP3100370.1 DUF2378 family protein [Myxococcus dinghuensis]